MEVEENRRENRSEEISFRRQSLLQEGEKEKNNAFALYIGPEEESNANGEERRGEGV